MRERTSAESAPAAHGCAFAIAASAIDCNDKIQLSSPAPYDFDKERISCRAASRSGAAAIKRAFASLK